MGRENNCFTPDIPDPFDVCQSFRFSDPTVVSRGTELVASQPDGLSWLFAMAHTYEFDRPEYPYGWDRVEALFRAVSGRTDIWYATNGEVIGYLLAARKFISDGGKQNNTDTTLYLLRDGLPVILAPGESC